MRVLLLAEQRRDVQRGTAGLPERQRRALAMRELEDRSYAEIGSEMGMRTNAVAQIVWRARTQLRRSLRRSQVDVDRLPDACRARLDAMSDLVDRASSSQTADLEAHMADCRDCRRTLATYQEAGSRLRGLAPVLPIVAVMGRLGSVLRAGAEMPMNIGTAAAVTAAAVATAGGGGALVSHYASTGHRAPAARALVHRTAHVVPRRASTLTVRPARGLERRESASTGRPVARPHSRRLISPVVAARATPIRPPAETAVAAGSPIRRPPPVPASPPTTSATEPVRTADAITKTRAEKETKVPPGQSDAPPGQAKTSPARTKAPPGHAKTPPGHAKTPPGHAKTPPGHAKTPPGHAKTPTGQMAEPRATALPPGKDRKAPNADAGSDSKPNTPTTPGNGTRPRRRRRHTGMRTAVPRRHPAKRPTATNPPPPTATSVPAGPSTPAGAGTLLRRSPILTRRRRTTRPLLPLPHPAAPPPRSLRSQRPSLRRPPGDRRDVAAGGSGRQQLQWQGPRLELDPASGLAGARASRHHAVDEGTLRP